MDSLDAVVAQVQALSGTPDDCAHLANLLKQTDNVLTVHAPRLSYALAALDPSKHSLGYLYLLEAQSAGSQTREQAGNFVVTASNFLCVCAADQIRLAFEKCIVICRRLKDHAIQINEPNRAICPLFSALSKLQPSTEHLTPLHADYLLLCLLAKTYKAGLPILEEDIFEIDQKRTGLTPRDFLLYCYYGYSHNAIYNPSMHPFSSIIPGCRLCFS
jgi:COP9 signalosome complex subunit 3